MALINITIEKLVIEVQSTDNELLTTILKAVNKNSTHLNHLQMTTTEAVAKIDAQTAQLAKVKTEVQNLKDAVANSANVDPAIEAALGRLDAAITGVDEINPDEVVNPDEPTEPEAPIEG